MAKYPIKIGATLTIDIQRVSNSAPVDLTNYTIESSIRHPKFGKYELDVIIVDAVEGRHRIVLSSDTSSNITAGNYTWDVVYTDPDGKVEIFPKTNEEVILEFSKGATK